MIQFFSDKSNQRKIAVALAAALALFGEKVPFLQEISPERIEWVLALVGVWLAQSGVKAAVEAHAEGKVAVVAASAVKPADALAEAPRP